MQLRICGVLVVVTLLLCIPLSTMAEDSGTITITMNAVNELSITLSETSWDLGDVVPSNTIDTIPPIEWCTLTVDGNCNVDTFVVGEDAEWLENPGAYKWTLSNDGSRGEHIYGLWFRISGDTNRGPEGDGYVPITKTEDEFWPYPANGSSLAPGDTKQFGLRLLTPAYFYGGRQMRTQVTISAVAA